MSGSYMYGMECYICGAKVPGARYRSHQSKFFFCERHTRDEVGEWLCRKAEPGEPTKERQP